MKFYPEGWLINTPGNRYILQDSKNILRASKEKRIVEGRAIVYDKNHNLVVDMGCMKGVIKRDECAIGIKEGFTKDISIMSRVNKPVCFVIEEIIKNSEDRLFAKLSRKIAQEMCLSEYINKLIPGDIINATVTHLENFGVFVDVGCGIISFLPIDAISISRISHPKERFIQGMDIKVIVKNIEKNNRLSLSHKELLGSWEQNAKLFSIGETVSGIVRSVENYGIFVELMPNLAGLAEVKENIHEGQQASVYIKNVIPSRMKIKLIIIDTFDNIYSIKSPRYFYKENHMEQFIYSPSCSKKIISYSFK